MKLIHRRVDFNSVTVIQCLLLGNIKLILWCRGFHPPILFKDKKKKNIVNDYSKEYLG